MNLPHVDRVSEVDRIRCIAEQQQRPPCDGEATGLQEESACDDGDRRKIEQPMKPGRPPRIKELRAIAHDYCRRTYDDRRPSRNQWVQKCPRVIDGDPGDEILYVRV